MEHYENLKSGALVSIFRAPSDKGARVHWSSWVYEWIITINQGLF